VGKMTGQCLESLVTNPCLLFLVLHNFPKSCNDSGICQMRTTRFHRDLSDPTLGVVQSGNDAAGAQPSSWASPIRSPSGPRM